MDPLIQVLFLLISCNVYQHPTYILCLQRRPDCPDLELAVPAVHQRADGAQPLRDVRPVPPQRGHGRLRQPRPDRQGLGHLRPQEEVRGPGARGQR